MWPFKKKVLAAPDAPAVDSLIRGYRFCATLQLRTPLAVLEMHGREIEADGPPPIVSTLWHGSWTPVTVSWRELGLDIDEMTSGCMSSDIGYVPSDGGDYLKLLKRIREVVEAPGLASLRRSRLKSLLNVLPWPELVERMGGVDAVADRLFPSFLAAGARLRPASVAALEQLGKTTPSQLAAMSDKDLLAVPSLGPKMLIQLRAACEGAAFPNESHVEPESAAT